MPIGNVSRDTAPKRDNYRPPWVKDKNADSPPSWTQKKLKPVEDAAKTAEDEQPAAKPGKPGLKKQATIREKGENGVSESAEEKLVKPTSTKQSDKPSKPTEDPKPKFTKPTLKSADKTLKTEEKVLNDKVPEKSSLKTVRTIDDKVANDKSNEKPNLKTVRTIDDKLSNDKLTEKPTLKTVRTIDDKLKNDKSTEKPNLKSVRTIDEKLSNDKPTEKPTLKTVRTIDEKLTNDKAIEKPTLKTVRTIDNKGSNEKLSEKPTLKTVRTIDDKAKEKSVTIIDKKPIEKEDTSAKATKNGPTKNSVLKNNMTNEKTSTNSSLKETKPVAKVTEISKESPKAEEKQESKSNMATKPPTPLEKTPSKLPPRKPPIQKQPSTDQVKKWRDPLHERVKKNIDDTLANEVPKGHTLTKNESLRSLLKPTPPPMPPPLPPKMPPPPDFKKAPIDPTKLKKIEQLRSRPRKRPDWSDMMKEVEEGRKLKHVVCNDRSSPIITKSSVVKNKEKDQFIFESEKPNSHNELLKEINKGIKLKKTKCNDRSKPNLEGLRKFRRQMTIEEQVQKSMSQANLQASPSGVSVAEVPATAEEEEIDEMDDIDKVRDDLQSTKQLLAIELRNKEAQERENKRLLTRIQNLEAELARERAIIKQEQHKTVISVTDAYDERLVNSLKMEVEKTKENADSLEKKYLDAAEDRDTALTELEELRRKNAELERKLEQALSNNLEELYVSEEPLSFYQKRQLDFEKQCRLLDIDINSPEAEALKKSPLDANNNAANANFAYTNSIHEGIMPTIAGSRRSSHAIKQLSVTKDDSFEEETESEEEEEESEEKKQRRMEKEIRNMKNKIRHLKEKQDNMKRERMGYKMALKNQQAALKDAKRKYKELKRDVDKMASMMKEVGSDEDEDEDEESEEETKSETEEEETETETEQDTESETESESEPEEAPLPNKKENLTKRLKRHETRVHALKKGNALLMANVDRLKDDVLKQREESAALQKELDSLIDDLE